MGVEGMLGEPDSERRHATGAVPPGDIELHSHDLTAGSHGSVHPQARNRSLWQSSSVLVLVAGMSVLSGAGASAFELRHPSLRWNIGETSSLTLRWSITQRSSPWLRGARLRGGMALNVTADHVPANGDAKVSPPLNGIADTANFTVDELKIEALRKLGASLRIGGPGTRRRKFKIVRKRQSKADEARFQNAMRRVGINPLNDIEEVQMFKNDGTVLNFDNPRVQANVHTNTYIVTGSYEEQKYQDYMPSMGMGANQQIDLEKLRKLAQSALPTEQGTEQDDDAEEAEEQLGTAEQQLEKEERAETEEKEENDVEKDFQGEEEAQVEEEGGGIGGGGACDVAEDHKPAVEATAA